MNTLSLNIGLAVGNVTTATETLDPLTALQAISQHLPATEIKEWYVRVHPLTGEPTLVVRMATRIAGPNTLAPCIHDLCLALRQDCISGKLVVRGEEIHEFLTGPKAEDYGGAFDATYWLAVTCDNAPQSTGVEGRGGNCYLEFNAAQVDLVDADGTTELPLAVITMLRQAGVFV